VILLLFDVVSVEQRTWWPIMSLPDRSDHPEASCRETGKAEGGLANGWLVGAEAGKVDEDEQEDEPCRHFEAAWFV
jgi:hypothetical protein